ncbi:hypothetical protein C8R46DRAFT_921270 [Mycena filopes]|nr:hypothetical protein C8R46DRAFT_921270 [Mycena filopes]
MAEQGRERSLRSLSPPPRREPGGGLSPRRSSVSSSSDRSLSYAPESPRPVLSDGLPFRDSSSRESYIHRLGVRDEVLRDIRGFCSRFTEFQAPLSTEAPGYWNLDWTDKVILVCEDERTIPRLKAWAACCGITDKADLLRMAMAYGVPFALYVRQSDVHNLGMVELHDDLLREALKASYSVGFTETPLPHGQGGTLLYGQYINQVSALLQRPHAIAFVQAGGILSFLAQMYDTYLIHRYMEGPSFQVREFAKGRTLWVDGELFTTDQVSEGEISILIGKVSTGKALKDTFLYPHPSWLEAESEHFHGAWTEGAWKFLQNLYKKHTVKKDYEWLTEREWRKRISNANKGAFRPSYVPTDDDFVEGLAVTSRAFPSEWNKKPLLSIQIPESLTSSADRE